MKMTTVLLAAGTMIGAALAAVPREESWATLIGRWDITVKDGDGEYPSWLEVKLSGRKTLVGSFVGRVGSARPISKVEFNDGKFHFAIPPQWERRPEDIIVEGHFDGDLLRGETVNAQGKKVSWEGRRAPLLIRDHLPQWGEPNELINGRDLSGWKPRVSGIKNGWVVKDGSLFNETPGNDLVSEQTFTDFKLHAEFRYPKGSNSGIYLRGRYEFQIEDNYGEAPDSLKIGGIYGFLTPSVNPAKKPGEWQSADVELVGRVVSVVFNGKRVIDRQTIPGVTGGALDSHEGEPGPLFIQGDHGQVEFRKLTLTPAK